MKSQFIFFAFTLFVLTACNGEITREDQGNSYTAESGFGNDNNEIADNEDNSATGGLLSETSGDNKTTHKFVDARTGLVVYRSEFPSAWEVISKPSYTMDQKLPNFLIQIQGPHNLKYFNIPQSIYISYDDPQTNQYFRNTAMGRMIRPEASIEQILQGEVTDRMKHTGFNYIGDRNIPQLARYIQNELNKTGIPNLRFKLLNTEWKNNSGQKALVIVSKFTLRQTALYSQGMSVWYYEVDYLFVDEPEYEIAVKNIVDATLSIKYNPEWERYRNLLMQERAQQQHQQNMQNQQSAFEAHQKKMQGIWAAEDANHAAFMNRTFGSNNSSDNSQQQFLNMINEEETVTNPATGKNYQVEAGSTQYWMDNDGNYIKNDDLFYNPNGDINLNEREWTKAQVQP